MLALSCLFAYLFLSTSDLLNFVHQLKGAIAFYSNYIFMNEDAYIADSSKYKVLLHTWSLGVEWQYYIVFPFIVYAIKKFFASQFEQILTLLFAISFFYCLHLMSINSTFAFYSTFSRVWELFFGGIVFLLSKKLKDTKFDSFLSALGVVIIFYSLIFFKDTDIQPGFISLVAVFGSALFILFTKENTFIYKLATLKIATFFGIISYSLYLYHQPILVFYRFRFGYSDIISNKIFVLLFLLMVLVSYLSYRFFENPIRRSKNSKKYLIVIFLMIVISVFGKGAGYTKGYENRQPESVREALKHFEVLEWVSLKSEKLGLSSFNGKEIYACHNRMPSTACKFGNSEKLDLVIIGDSFSGVFSNSLSQKVSSIIFTNGSCPLLVDEFFKSDNKRCPEINKLRWIELEKIKPTNILVGANFNSFRYYIYETKKVQKEEVYKSFRKSIEKLISMGFKPIVLLQPPNPTIDVAKEMKRRVMSGILEFKDEYQATPTTNIDNEVRKALEGLNVKYIDMNKNMCKDGKCLTFNKNGGLFNKDEHLSYFGVQLFVDDIINSLK